MELTKNDTQRFKGVAIIGMVMLHLFCRLSNLPYSPSIYIGSTPLIYYFGLFGDLCVPVFCFCSGYAHFLINEKNQTDFLKTIPNKAVRFLLNYWIVLILFAIIGLVSGNAAEIPVSVKQFLGNFFLFGLSYNGAWWFVLTYLLLLILSPLAILTAKKLNSIFLIILSFCIYIVSYYFRFQYSLEISNTLLKWLWTQLILLGTSQFGYSLGLICRKERIVTKIREVTSSDNPIASVRVIYRRALKVTIFVLPAAAFLGHCIVQSVFISPFTAVAIIVFLCAFDLPKFIDAALVFMGKHSTNIWLIHMFFYLCLFDNLVFCAKYPLSIFLMMIAICLAFSYVIKGVERILLKLLRFI